MVHLPFKNSIFDHRVNPMSVTFVLLRLNPNDVRGKRMEAVLSLVEGDMQRRIGLSKASKLRRTVPRTEHVLNSRTGITAVSSIWGNGDLGPLAMCVANGSLKRTFIAEINQCYHGAIFIFESGSESHYMNAETTLLYLSELIAPVT